MHKVKIRHEKFVTAKISLQKCLRHKLPLKELDCIFTYFED